MKRKVIWGILVVFWLVLGTVLFITSRGHSLLVDNRNQEIPPITAPGEIIISVDGREGAVFYRGDRDRFSVTGSKHRIRVEFTDGTAPFEDEFTLPIKDDMYILSIPRLINGIDPFVEVFRVAPEPRSVEEASAVESLAEPLP